jgi:hypothetical protein
MTQLILGSSVPAIEFFLSILPGSLFFLVFITPVRLETHNDGYPEARASIQFVNHCTFKRLMI